MKTVQNNSYGWNSRETINICVGIMNSKWQVEGKRGQWYKFTFAVNLTLDLSIMFLAVWQVP